MPLDNLSHDSGTGRRRHHSESLTRGVHGYEPVRGIAARATSDLLLTTLKRYVAATGGELPSGRTRRHRAGSRVSAVAACGRRRAYVCDLHRWQHAVLGINGGAHP